MPDSALTGAGGCVLGCWLLSPTWEGTWASLLGYHKFSTDVLTSNLTTQNTHMCSEWSFSASAHGLYLSIKAWISIPLFPPWLAPC